MAIGGIMTKVDDEFRIKLLKFAATEHEWEHVHGGDHITSPIYAQYLNEWLWIYEGYSIPFDLWCEVTKKTEAEKIAYALEYLS